MRSKGLSLILLVFFVLFFGCSASKEAVIFDTPFGKIPQGMGMPDVMNVLGNPHDITVLPQERAELWYYYFGDDKKIYVYFVDKKVSKVRDTIEEKKENQEKQLDS